MSAPKHARIVRKRRNGMLDDFVVTDGLGLLVRDIQVITARESDT
jgi:hypothetical protein